MKLARKVSLLMAYLCCVAAYTSAQKTTPAEPLGPPEPDFTIEVKHEYRKGEVITLVSLERMLIQSPDASGEPIGFSSLFAYDEKSHSAVLVYISFYSEIKKCRFPTDPEVTFNVDGESFRVGFDLEAAQRGEGIAMSFAEPERGRCQESLDVLLPQKLYLKVAKARNVEVRTGKLKFKLSAMHLKALSELARLMVSPN